MRFSRKILTEAPADGATPFKLPSDMLNNPSSIDLKGMAAKAKAEADKKAAEEEQARIFAANKAKYSDLITKAQEAGSPDDMLDALFQELVPRSGQADTVAGELVRAMMRILYRDYNDGDLFYEGYGIETCGSSVAYLISIIDDLYAKFHKIADLREEDDTYTDSLNDICNDVLNYIFTNDSVWMPNTEDSRGSAWEQVYDRDYKDDWQPEYEAELEIPEEVQAHMEAGNISTWDVIDEVRNWFSWNNGFDRADIERPWSHNHDSTLSITGLTRDGQEQIEQWNRDSHTWDDYINNLNDEYGDPDEEDDEDDDWDNEDDDVDESIDKSSEYKVGQKVLYHGKETTIRGIEHSKQYGYDILIDNPEFSTRKYPGEDAWKYKKIWVGEDVTPIERTLNENMDEQIIIGFGADGKRSYYNDVDKEWKDSPKEATIYPDNDSARDVWFKLDKKPFKRVFIACNTEGV